MNLTWLSAVRTLATSLVAWGSVFVLDAGTASAAGATRDPVLAPLRQPGVAPEGSPSRAGVPDPAGTEVSQGTPAAVDDASAGGAATPPAPSAPASVAPAPGGELQELQIGRSDLPPPPPQVAVPLPGGSSRAVARPQTMEEISNGAGEELDIRVLHWRYSLNFFGDVSLALGHPSSPDHPLSFALGVQDILIKGELANHVVATTEVSLEPQPDSSFGVDVERFNVRWHSDDGFFVEAGRSHTFLGYWNNAYHHGRWLQLTIDRPRWVAFEDDGGLLPVHWVGLTAGAKLRLGPSTLNLAASVGNGRGKIVDDVRNAGDYQNMKAFHASADLVGIVWPELRAGVAGVVDRIPGLPMLTRPDLPDGTPIDELIGSAHVAYASVPLLFIAESYLVIHRAEQRRWSTFGGFVLLGYTFGRLTPYLEFERIASRGGSDPFFHTVLDPAATASAAPFPSFDTAEGIGGLRLDLSDWTSLKIEYRFTRTYDTATNFQEGVLNWSWGF